MLDYALAIKVKPKKWDVRLHPICDPAITENELAFQIEELVRAAMANAQRAFNRRKRLNWNAAIEKARINLCTGDPL